MEDRKVASISQVNFNGYKCPFIAVHKYPSDYPDKYLARVFDMDTPTNIIMLKDSLEEIQRDIRKHTNMVFFKREDADVESLIGAWG